MFTLGAPVQLHEWNADDYEHVERSSALFETCWQTAWGWWMQTTIRLLWGRPHRFTQPVYPDPTLSLCIDTMNTSKSTNRTDLNGVRRISSIIEVCFRRWIFGINLWIWWFLWIFLWSPRLSRTRLCITITYDVVYAKDSLCRSLIERREDISPSKIIR